MVNPLSIALDGITSNFKPLAIATLGWLGVTIEYIPAPNYGGAAGNAVWSKKKKKRGKLVIKIESHSHTWKTEFESSESTAKFLIDVINRTSAKIEMTLNLVNRVKPKFHIRKK
jgi:hypothetical protein